MREDIIDESKNNRESKEMELMVIMSKSNKVQRNKRKEESYMNNEKESILCK